MRNHPAPALTTALILAAVGAVGWFAWCGWGTDPETREYAVWQVAGYALSLLGAALFAVWRGRPWLPLLVLPVTAAVAFSATAAPEDRSGLWMVGAVLVLLGTAVGTALLGAAGQVYLHLRRKRR